MYLEYKYICAYILVFEVVNRVFFYYYKIELAIQLYLLTILTYVFTFNLSITIHSSMKIHHKNRIYFAQHIIRCYALF